MSSSPRAFRFLLVLFLLAGLAGAQYRRYPGGGYGSGPRMGRGSRAPGQDAGVPEPAASFSGVVHSYSGKVLRIEDSNSEMLEFEASRKTEYYEGSQKIKASAIEAGQHVTVEARHAKDGKLEAVAVRLDSREQPKPSLKQRANP